MLWHEIRDHALTRIDPEDFVLKFEETVEKAYLHQIR